MTEIQRWAPFDPMALMGRHPNGAFVTYADHVAAVAAATENAVRDYAEEHYANGVKRYSDGVKAAREAVIEVSQHDHPDIDPLEFDTSFDYAKAICEAAIDGITP